MLIDLQGRILHVRPAYKEVVNEKKEGFKEKKEDEAIDTEKSSYKKEKKVNILLDYWNHIDFWWLTI